MRTLTGIATLTVLLVGLVAVPTAQGKPRYGKIVVEKSISLKFPAPGIYQGIVKVGKTKIKKVATKGGRRGRATKKAKGQAAKRARRHCIKDMKGEKVTVTHLSKPPFRIGTDFEPSPIGGRPAASYTVTGEQPPTGEKVLAEQTFFLLPVVRTGSYRWSVYGVAAKDIKPYPY